MSSETPRNDKLPHEPLDAPDRVGLGSWLLALLRELSAMGRSEDLLGRYQSFSYLVELSLSHALGPATVSFWCPDAHEENLEECLIRPAGSTGVPRRPCHLPLDAPLIREALDSGQACFPPAGEWSRRSNDPALPCDACIPLCRPYGQPLLVVIERQGKQRHPDDHERFLAAVQFVRFFWEQLQALNQRQWLAEHEPDSRALRAEAFLTEAQAWARQLCDQDEPFAVVVLTVRGFRGMFARNAGQWRRLSGLVGAGLDAVLRDTHKRFLLGKTADDVFVLFLGGADVFLAQSAMDALGPRLESHIKDDRLSRTLEVLAVELSWAVADHHQYNGSVERLLHEVYAHLFARNPNSPPASSTVVLKDDLETSTSAATSDPSDVAQPTDSLEARPCS